MFLYKHLVLKRRFETAPWPQADAAALIEDEILVVVQSNGKGTSKNLRSGRCHGTTSRKR